ncbi:T9SS type A sorting domain-containing protein, partial [Fibrobacterota bacterium]
WRETQTPIGINQNIVIDKMLLYLDYNPQKSLIYFSLPFQCNVNLEMYDLRGRVVERLVNTYKTAGRHSFQINTKEYSSGVYFLRLIVGNASVVKNIMICK